MKKNTALFILLITLFSCNTEVPTQFSEAALNDTFVALDGSKVKFKDILKKHKGKQIVIDVWASWCGDCIKGMPKVKAIQKQYPDAVYLFLSMDKKQDTWKRGITAFNVKGEHYFVGKDWGTPFCEFIDLDWIPRYIVVDTNGNIKLFEATRANDKNITKALKS